MKKKSSASSQQEKPQKKNKNTISNTAAKTKIELQNLSRMKNNEIDLSDIPELNFDQLEEPTAARFYKPIKKQISIRLDADVLDWLQHSTQKYQTLINKICRAYMESHRKKRA